MMGRDPLDLMDGDSARLRAQILLMERAELAFVERAMEDAERASGGEGASEAQLLIPFLVGRPE